MSKIDLVYLINRYFAEPYSSLVSGILLGNKIAPTSDFYLQIKQSGLLHLVVLSGSNIAILGSIMSFLTSWISRRISLLITILTVILFNIFIGFQAPLIRSSLMVTLTSVAGLLGRQSHSLYTLFLTALAMIILWPNLMGDLSFQLSFSSTLGILLFSGGYSQKKSFMHQFLMTELKTGLAAYTFTAPIIAFNFQQISLIGITSNVLVSPFIPSIMILGIIMVALGKISFILGIVPSYLLYGMISWVLFVIRISSQVPYGFIDFSR